jgi:branched-chain amino acid transport system substrate-binding protein
MTRLFKTVSPLAILLPIIALYSACGSSEEEVVRFGLATPLEMYLGVQTQRGAEMARDEINASGGIAGKSLELVAVTDSASGERALQVAADFMEDESVVAVVGHSTSGATIAASSIYDRGLPVVSPTATSPEVSDAGPWIFRVASSDVANSSKLAMFSLRELGDRAVLLYANDSYGRGLREGFVRAYEASGGTLLEQYPYIEGQTTDFEAFLLAIRAAQPDLIFIAGLDVTAGVIIQQARDLGIETPVIGGDGIMGLVGQGPLFEGTYVGLLYHPEFPSEAGPRFVEAFTARHGQAPDHFAALAYDAVMLLAEAVRQVGPDRAKIRDYLESVGANNDPFEGVSGSIFFDENGDPERKNFAIGRIVGTATELVAVEGGS